MVVCGPEAHGTDGAEAYPGHPIPANLEEIKAFI